MEVFCLDVVQILKFMQVDSIQTYDGNKMKIYQKII